MADDSFVSILLQPATPLYLALVFLVGYGVKIYPLVLERINEARRDKAAIDHGLYERLAARCEKLETSEQKCRADLADAVKRIAELEGYMIGTGAAKQDAQRIVSTEREVDARKREEGK